MSDKFKFFSDPLNIYSSMLKDIEDAKKYIYFEIYIFENDSIGEKFRNTLLKKAKQGLEIKILIDSWGATVSKAFFSEIIENGGEVRFFKKINARLNIFTESHRRDHRKILVIDDRISYVGSANVTVRCLNWRESMFKIEGDIANAFRRIFIQNYNIYNKYIYDKKKQIKYVLHDGYQIIRDVPSIRFQQIKKKFIQLIRNACKEIIIETPYFLPGSMLRKELMKASLKGIEVKVIMPRHSDIRMVDILREMYFGQLHRSGIKLYFYTPQNLHSKLMLIDKETFVLGSANFDYRSFRYQFEMILTGKNPELAMRLDEHLNNSINDTNEFVYDIWKKRPLIQKIFEKILIPFRHIF
ncbi:MAG: phosphatidylserine/phosphatidylglycerophosphate/cardiolipin synthase family protein [Bacteroidota bacterium]|nr:phosphatidylserine/phosphatidylglycerophosphate/cardiolipin synthase family protein [Bacteroidota bacterium]